MLTALFGELLLKKHARKHGYLQKPVLENLVCFLLLLLLYLYGCPLYRKQFIYTGAILNSFGIKTPRDFLQCGLPQLPTDFSPIVG